MSNWMIYGTGYTAGLIAEEAVRRGHAPIIAGRSPDKARKIADPLGLEWANASVGDSRGLLDIMAPVDLVLNTAGPFIGTCAPILEACLASKTHYLDISNEIEVFKIAESRHAAALQAGIAIFPGAGFGTLASNHLARIACGHVEAPVSLEIAIAPFVATHSAGASKSAIDALSKKNYVVEHGKLAPIPLGSGIRKIPFSDKIRNALPVSSGDLEAARLAFGLPAITVYWPSPLPPMLARVLLPIIQRLLSVEWVREKIGKFAEEKNRTHQPIGESGSRSQLWVRVQGAKGDCVEMRMETGEGYAFTASASIRMVEATLSNPSAGLTTAALYSAECISQMVRILK